MANTGAYTRLGVNTQTIPYELCRLITVYAGTSRFLPGELSMREWATPEFLEQAAKELIEEKWQKVTTAKLPEATSLRLG